MVRPSGLVYTMIQGRKIKNGGEKEKNMIKYQKNRPHPKPKSKNILRIANKKGTVQLRTVPIIYIIIH
jgi:hypothetical protein